MFGLFLKVVLDEPTHAFVVIFVVPVTKDNGNHVLLHATCDQSPYFGPARVDFEAPDEALYFDGCPAS